MHPLTSSSTASHIWRRVRTKMGLQGEHEFVLHAFRHTYGSTLANTRVDAFRIQQLMGHANIVTTQGYVRVSMNSLDIAPSIMEERVTKRDQNVDNCDQNKEGNSDKIYA